MATHTLRQSRWAELTTKLLNNATTWCFAGTLALHQQYVFLHAPQLALNALAQQLELNLAASAPTQELSSTMVICCTLSSAPRVSIAIDPTQRDAPYRKTSTFLCSSVLPRPALLSRKHTAHRPSQGIHADGCREWRASAYSRPCGSYATVWSPAICAGQTAPRNMQTRKGTNTPRRPSCARASACRVSAAPCLQFAHKHSFWSPLVCCQALRRLFVPSCCAAAVAAVCDAS